MPRAESARGGKRVVAGVKNVHCGALVSIEVPLADPSLCEERARVLADDGDDQWRVQCEGGRIALVRSSNLRVISPSPSAGETDCLHVHRGARVSIRGLVSRPELNGREAVALTYFADGERWSIRCDDGTAVKARASNLRVLSSPLLVPPTVDWCVLNKCYYALCQKVMKTPQVCSSCMAVPFCSLDCLRNEIAHKEGGYAAWKEHIQRDVGVYLPGGPQWLKKATGHNGIYGERKNSLLASLGLEHFAAYRIICGLNGNRSGSGKVERRGGRMPNVTSRTVDRTIVGYSDGENGGRDFLKRPESVEVPAGGMLKTSASGGAVTVRSWAEYYAARGFNSDSPLELLMTHALTLYHFLHNYVGQTAITE